MAEFARVLPEVELAIGTNRAVDVHGQSVLLCRTSDGIFAVANECTHQKMALEGGRVKGNAIFCPEHGVRFDLRTGCPTGSLTNQPLECFDVRISEGFVEVARR